ncbi:MAG: serine/threonine-protein kinase [Myxococcota bacterium]|nr:serine/threonine-protein kinase [Myxococcota bacterium]
MVEIAPYAELGLNEPSAANEVTQGMAQRYTVLERIDSGGMAEVWKGRLSSLEGFDKNIAIKRVLPHLAQNKKFMSMFLDEARLSLHLNHANIVQTFDIGVSDNSYYIVMEWINGANLKNIMETAIAQRFRIPREQAVFIAIEVCKGLSHAHNRQDSDGQNMGIVHRDVSPPNILVSREGEVKLVDFGLAKAVTQLSATDPGVIKGKFSYLSPEAAKGEVVDYRADIFSVGILLWEMLAGRRLFEGRSNLETVKMVRAAEIPSLRSFNPKVEPQLEDLLNRALAVDASDRFQSAEQLGHELSRYLFANQLLVTSYDVAELVKRVQAERAMTTPMKVVTPELMANAAQMQGELGGFVSLEELEKMSFVSVSTGNVEATDSTSMDTEDPRSWAGEFALEPQDEFDDVTLLSSDMDLVVQNAAALIKSRKSKPIPTTKDSSGSSATDPSISGTDPSEMKTDENPPVPKRHTIPSGHFEPIIERLNEEADDRSTNPSESISVMEFSAPPPARPSMPLESPPLIDGSVIRGIIAGLMGAALIIYLTWRFLIP